MWLRGSSQKETMCDPKLSLGLMRPRHAHKSLPAIGDDIVICDPDPGDLLRPVNCKAMAKTLQEVDKGEAPWGEVCFIQFAGATEQNDKEAIGDNPNVQLLGGRGFVKQHSSVPLMLRLRITVTTVTLAVLVGRPRPATRNSSTTTMYHNRRCVAK